MPETWTAIGIMAAFGLGALALHGTFGARIDKLGGRIDKLIDKIDQLGRDLRQEMKDGFARVDRRFEAHEEQHRAAEGG
jgi:hypothetical protein